MDSIRSTITYLLLPIIAAVLGGLTLVFVVIDPDDPFLIALLEGALALVMTGLLVWIGYQHVLTTDSGENEAWIIGKWTLAGVVILAILNIWFRFLNLIIGDVEVRFALTTSLAVGALGGALVGISLVRARLRHAEREQALADYEELFQKAEDGIFITDPESGTVLDVNQRGADLYGYTVEELEGMTIEAISADDPEFSQEQAFEKMQRAVDGQPQQFDWLGERKDGSHLWLEISLKRTSIGGKARLIAIARDISDRKRYVEQIEMLHEATRDMVQAADQERVAEIAVVTCRTVLGHSLNGVWLFDDTTDTLRPVASTREGTKLIGTIPTFAVDGPGLIPEAFETNEPQYHEDVRSVDGVHNPDTPIGSELIHPLGEYGVLTIGSTEVDAFTDTERSLSTLFATNIEVALDRVAQERELSRQNERLDNFAGVVSHDLRNPLNIAKGRLELVREECDSTHLDPIERSHDRMQSMIDDLLMLAREGHEIDDTVPVDLADVVARCWQNVETSQGSLDVRTSLSLEANRSRLQQLLENLIRNAVEHGDENVTITVGEHERGFYVEDDGVGIPDEDREQLFEAGYSTSESGTGIGLTIVREIVEGHGWEISVTEGTDGGARFEISGIDR